MSEEQSAIDAKLGDATLRGVRWTFIGRVVVEVSSFAASVVLARLIAPAQFGQAAIALIVVSLAVVLAPQGFGALLVRMDDLRREHLETAAFLSLVSACVFTALTLVCVPFVVEPLFGHTTGVLVAIASPVWMLSALTTTPLVALQRSMNFRRLAIIELVARTSGSATSVAFALAGLNALAIVLGWITFSIVLAFGYLTAAPFVFPRLRISAVREIASFGAVVSLSSLVYTAFRNIDYALVGVRLGPAALGFYWRAYQLGVDYQGKISIVMQRVAFPVYSRSADLDGMRRLRLRIARMHAIVIFPLLGLLVVLAPKAIPLLFGSQWHASVVPTQILAFAGMGAALTAGAGPLFVAAGRPLALLGFNAANLVIYGVMIYVLAPFGLNTVCVAVATFTAISTVALYVLMGRLLQMRVASFALETLPAAASTLILIAAAWSVGRLLPNLPALIDMGASSLVGVAAYALLLKYVFPEAFGDVALLVGRLVPRLAVA